MINRISGCALVVFLILLWDYVEKYNTMLKAKQSVKEWPVNMSEMKTLPQDTDTHKVLSELALFFPLSPLQ
jgi:hypothetical protein